jgi:hypothetical protein
VILKNEAKKKNPAALALARLAIKAREAKYSTEQLRQMSADGQKTRWKDHEYSQKPGAIYQRERRAKLKQKSKGDSDARDRHST